MTQAHEYAKANGNRFFEQYQEILRIPSVSTQPEHAGDVQRAAAWLADDMRRIGFGKAEVIKMPEGRHPLVLGEWNGAGKTAPTVLIYCHYDVQPAAMEDGWDSDPFEPVERNGKLYARGAVDSKLHVMAQLKAVESLLATEAKSPVNIKLLLEGEEESGSENINAFFEEHGDRLKADVCVISDGCILDETQPSLVYGLRGIVSMELHVTGPAQDLHSGHFGGTTHNPLQALAEIIARLHDASGEITVPGFYDDVLLLDEDEREDLAKINAWVDEEWRQVANSPHPWGEAEYSLHERVGARPTLEINGIQGGFTGTGVKTVLPHKAFAKISCRLVAQQEPQRIFECIRDHIRAITPPTVRSELIRQEPGARAVLLDRKSRAMQAASAAYEFAWGTKAVFERAGATLPIASQMQKIVSEIVLMGFGFKSGIAHGPNENIHVLSFHRGVSAAIYFLQEIAKSAE